MRNLFSPFFLARVKLISNCKGKFGGAEEQADRSSLEGSIRCASGNNEIQIPYFRHRLVLVHRLRLLSLRECEERLLLQLLLPNLLLG